MENMDKGITVPKWVLTVWPKIPKRPQNLSAQFVFPRFHWASIFKNCTSQKMTGKYCGDEIRIRRGSPVHICISFSHKNIAREKEKIW